MKYGRIAALMGAILASGAVNQTNAVELKAGTDINIYPPIPFNLSRSIPRASSGKPSVAKDRRAAKKRRNILSQKRHPNCRSAGRKLISLR